MYTACSAKFTISTALHGNRTEWAGGREVCNGWANLASFYAFRVVDGMYLRPIEVWLVRIVGVLLYTADEEVTLD